MPQIGQSPGLSAMYVGCIGQWYLAGRLLGPCRSRRTSRAMTTRATASSSALMPTMRVARLERFIVHAP